MVHSGLVSGSISGVAGVRVVVRVEFCVKTFGRKRRSRKRPAIDEDLVSCEDAVMVMTSPLTAKVGLWDTAAEQERNIYTGFIYT